MKTKINLKALSKLILVIVGIWLVFFTVIPYFDMTYSEVGKTWVSKVIEYSNNSTEYILMTPEQKVVFLSLPIYYILPASAFYFLVRKRHRKNLVINGQVEGKVIFIYGLRKGRGHLYDLVSMLRGFRHVDWRDFPRPFSQNLYDGKVMIYYSTGFLENPVNLKRVSVVDPRQIRMGFYTMWIEGKYSILRRPSNDPTHYYVEYFNELPYDREDYDMDTFKKYHKANLVQIQKDNTDMLQSNPEIVGKMLQASLFILPTSEKQEYLELLPKEAREKYLREGYEKLELEQ